MRHKHDPSYSNLLKRIERGEITVDDWHVLNSRDPSVVDKPSDYSEIISLMDKDPKVQTQNTERLLAENKPIARIIGVHSDSRAANIKAKDMMHLKPVLHICIGAKVMLRHNLSVRDGLVNGAEGYVRDIIWDHSKTIDHLPRCIVVEFPQYSGPQLLPGPASYAKMIPLVPRRAECDDRGTSRTRLQYPFQLCWAMSIHKSQGCTLERVIVDIGESENWAVGLTYVGLSRVKTLNGLFLVSKGWSRYQKINDSKANKSRIRAEDLLRRREERVFGD